MKAGWQTKKFGEVLQKTETTNPPQFPEQEFDYIDVSSVSNKTFQIEETQRLKGKDAPSRARRLVKTDDILFATVRPTLQRIAIVPESLNNQVCSTGYFVLRPIKTVDYRYLYYSLFTDDFIEQMEKLQKGASYPAVTDVEVRSQILSFPPLPEQQRIVAILDEAFEGIATAAANAKKNLNNARELFDSYLQSVFTSKGDGWEEKTLNQISENLDSKRVPITKSVRSNGSYPYYGASGIVDYVDDFIFDDDLLLVSEDGANLLARTYPIAFSVSGKTWVNNHAHVLRFQDITTQKFVEFYLNSIPLDDYVSGMAQPKLNQKMLNTIVIPYPALSEQQRIVTTLKALSVETKKLEAIYQQKLTALDELKKSILNQAFSGQLH